MWSRGLRHHAATIMVKVGSVRNHLWMLNLGWAVLMRTDREVCLLWKGLPADGLLISRGKLSLSRGGVRQHIAWVIGRNHQLTDTWGRIGYSQEGGYGIRWKGQSLSHVVVWLSMCNLHLIAKKQQRNPEGGTFYFPKFHLILQKCQCWEFPLRLNGNEVD